MLEVFLAKLIFRVLDQHWNMHRVTGLEFSKSDYITSPYRLGNTKCALGCGGASSILGCTRRLP